MTMAPGLRCNHSPNNFNSSDRLQITRALGHNGSTSPTMAILMLILMKQMKLKLFLQVMEYLT